MADLIQQADAIRTLAKLFKNMGDAADTLESIGTLDQALQERKASLAVLDAQVDGVKAAAQAKLDEANAALDSAKWDASSIVDTANVEAARILADASLKVASLHAEATSAIEAKTSTAQFQTDRLAAEVTARAEKVKADTDAMQAKYDEIAPQVAGAQAELIRLNDAIAQARAKIYEMMGTVQ